jgi:transketolase
MRILGLQDVFAPTGSAEFLLEHFKLTAHGMRDAALELLAERR